jgi:two-component system phosphate regulon sensor histidine kinase PhoR
MSDAIRTYWHRVAWAGVIVLMAAGGALAVAMPTWGITAWAQWSVLSVTLVLGCWIAILAQRRMRLDAVLRTSQLETQQRELLGILQGMRIAVVVIDRTSRVLSMNPAACSLLGCETKTPCGSTLEDLAIDTSLCAFVEAAIARGGHRSGDLHMCGGEGCDVVLRSEPVHDGNGALHSIVLVLDDVTRLRQLEVMRSDFAANVSHELRTPITAIQGYSELLAEAPADAVAEYAQVIHRNSKRLSNIIEDLLALSKLEGGEQADALDHEPVAVHELFDAVVRACGDEAAQAGVTIAVCCDDLLIVNGSAPLLEQALGNLVINAIRYGGTNATVQLKAEATGPIEVCMSIKDHGPGIPPEHHARVFERFYRVDRGRSRHVGGTGLGLAIVKHIALVHGGSVNLSRTDGGGCTFTLRLPLDCAAANG